MTAYNGFQPGANLYTQGFGSRPEDVEVPHLDSRAPTSTDTRFPIGKVWLDAVNGNFYGLANFLTSAGVLTANWVALNASSSFVAPGSITAASGNITATNGNLVLGTAGNKISIATGANASVGTSAAMTAGSIVVSTSAVTASSIIFVSYNTLAGTTGAVSAPAASRVPGTSFTITSSSNSDTSTVNWWIIN